MASRERWGRTAGCSLPGQVAARLLRITCLPCSPASPAAACGWRQPRLPRDGRRPGLAGPGRAAHSGRVAAPQAALAEPACRGGAGAAPCQRTAALQIGQVGQAGSRAGNGMCVVLSPQDATLRDRRGAAAAVGPPALPRAQVLLPWTAKPATPPLARTCSAWCVQVGRCLSPAVLLACCSGGVQGAHACPWMHPVSCRCCARLEAARRLTCAPHAPTPALWSWACRRCCL